MPYPLVNKQFAIENGPVEIVKLPIKSVVDLSIVFCQRLPECKSKMSKSKVFLPVVICTIPKSPAIGEISKPSPVVGVWRMAARMLHGQSLVISSFAVYG